jgi:hypothetical protein
MEASNSRFIPTFALPLRAIELAFQLTAFRHGNPNCPFTVEFDASKLNYIDYIFAYYQQPDAIQSSFYTTLHQNPPSRTGRTPIKPLSFPVDWPIHRPTLHKAVQAFLTVEQRPLWWR